MIRSFLFIFIAILVCNNAQAIALFKAEYEVFQDGKKSALSSTELTHQDSTYVLTDKTHGTHGMASFLGFKRQEHTSFVVDNGLFIPESYALNQKVAFKKRQSSFSLDKQANVIKGKYKGKKWTLSAPGSFLTTNLVSLRLSQDICAGKTDNFRYPIIKDGKLKNYRFVITEEINNIVEIDRVHSKSSRITKTWLDRNQNCLPIKTFHVEKDKDPIETKLISVNYQ